MSDNKTQPAVAPAAQGHFVPDDMDYKVPGVAAGANPVMPNEEKKGITAKKAISFSDEQIKELEARENRKAEIENIDLEAESPPKANTGVEKAEVEESNCKHCKRNLKAMLGVPKISEEDRKAWMRHVLGEPRFIREYSLMGGTVKIKLRNRTVKETESVYAELTRQLESKELPAGSFNSTLYYFKLSQLNLAITVERVELHRETGKPTIHVFPEVNEETYPPRDKKDKRFPCGRAYEAVQVVFNNEALASMALAAQRHFEGLVNELISRSDDPDFWLAAVGEV